MNFKIITTIATAFTLAACQMNPSATEISDIAHNTVDITETNIAGKWQLVNPIGQNNSPLTLHFANGKVAVQNGCNNIQASYQISANHLSIGSPMSTRMACEQHLMDLDQLATQLLQSPMRLKRFVDARSPEQLQMDVLVNGKLYQLTKVHD